MSYKGTKWIKNMQDWEISSSYDKPTPQEISWKEDEITLSKEIRISESMIKYLGLEDFN